MLNILKSVRDSINKDIHEITYGEPDFVYTEAVKMINEHYQNAAKIVDELKAIFRDDVSRIGNTELVHHVFRIHSFVINPTIPLLEDKLIPECVKTCNNSEAVMKCLLSKSSVVPVSAILDIAEKRDCRNCLEREYLKVSGTVTVPDVNFFKKVLIKLFNQISMIAWKLSDIRDICINELSNYQGDRDKINCIAGTACRIFCLYMAYVNLYLLAGNEVFSACAADKLITESVSHEDVQQYVRELNEMIPKIREFYDKFQYKELLVPRKKKIEKMEEYMMGALERKYDLKIPIYKVEGRSKDVKDIIEEKFIKKLDSIVDKYPNFVLLTPNFDEDSDMFIYITLKEPFGDKKDREDRVQQSKEDGAVITESISMRGFIKIGALLAIGTASSVSVIKNVREKNKNDRKMNTLSAKKYDLMYCIEDIIKIIEKAKFIKCKKGTYNFIEESLKVVDRSHKKYNILIKEMSNFENYYNTHIVNESVAKLKKIISEGESVYSNLKSDINKLEKKYIENEWIDCDSSKLSALLRKFKTYEAKYDYLNIYNKFFDGNFDKKVLDAIVIKGDYFDPDYERLSYFFEAYNSLMYTSIEKIKNFIKVQLKGKMMNESISLNESALTSKERNELPDSVFGIPNGRHYPLHDKDHILNAIQRFKSCAADDRKLLASNIVKRIIESDLVGDIVISEKNTSKEYFPKWMQSDKAVLKKSKGSYKIYIDGEEVASGSLTESASECPIDYIL